MSKEQVAEDYLLELDLIVYGVRVSGYDVDSGPFDSLDSFYVVKEKAQARKKEINRAKNNKAFRRLCTWGIFYCGPDQGTLDVSICNFKINTLVNRGWPEEF